MPEPIVVAQEERRTFRRIPSKLKVQARLSRVTEEGLWLATVRNLSQEGIGLMINRTAKPGMTLTVELPALPPVMRKPTLVQVTHVRAQTGGQWWMLGGTFVKKLSKEELDLLTARKPLISPEVERRTTVRLTTKLKTACPLVRATEEGPWWASVRNVSLRGVSLITNRSFPGNCFVTVELPTKAGGLSTSRLMKVRHSRPQPGNKWWIVGCQFLTKLTRDELLEMV